MLSRAEAAQYLAAIIDGEGCVSKLVPGRWGSRRVMICNTDMDILDATKECLEILGIGYVMRIEKMGTLARKQAYGIYIHRMDALLRLLETVPIRSTQKLERLKETCASFRNFQLDEDLVAEQYVDGYSIQDLATMHECSISPIRNALINKNVTRRKRWETSPKSLA